jgi:hypothetical protein
MQFAFRWMKNCLLMREIGVKKHREDVGYLSDTSLSGVALYREEKQRYTDGGWAYDSPKVHAPFLSFIFTSVQRFSSSGATSSVQWISRFVEGFMRFYLSSTVHGISYFLLGEVPYWSLCSGMTMSESTLVAIPPM